MIENIENKHILDALIAEHGEIEGTTIFNNLEENYYESSESMELYDPINDQYYNLSGQTLKNPETYDEWDQFSNE
jgi:hypothetical protein